MCGSKIINSVITGHSSQHRMNGPLLSMSWKFWCYSAVGPCGCWRGIQSHCITLSLCSMTYLIIWMALCRILLKGRISRRRTCFSPSIELDRYCPYNTLKWLQWQVCFSFLHISLISSWSCNRFGCGTMEWILILRMKHPILRNTGRSFWRMWKLNTGANIDVWQSINPETYRAAILSPPQWLQDPVNHPSRHIICPVMVKNTQRQIMCLKWHPDDGITPHC